jgi:translation elongation factor EF-4
MDVERTRITIKRGTVKLVYTALDGRTMFLT